MVKRRDIEKFRHAKSYEADTVKWVKKNPDQPYAAERHAHAGDAFYGARELDRAKKAYENALKQDERSLSAHNEYILGDKQRVKVKRRLRALERVMSQKKKKGFWKTLVPIIGIVAGIFLLSPNITGNIVGNLSNNVTSWVGGILFLFGLIAGFFWLKSGKKN